MTDTPLHGMGALVTGGAGGIGSACATWLARDGAAVTIMGRTEAKLEAAVTKIAHDAGAGAQVSYVVGDANEPAALDAAVATAEAVTGTLNICVTTVGGSTIVPLLMTEPEQFRYDLERNTVSAFLAIKHATPALVRAGGGAIVCVSSDAATMSWQFMAGYCAGKAGLEALVRVAADELGHLGVRVNAVRPGLVAVGAERHRGLFDKPEVLREFIDRKPLGRTGIPDDIGAAVRYLAGPESAWVTGQSLGVEGGNELRGAPRLEAIVRDRWDGAAVDEALAGRIPPVDRPDTGNV